MAHGFPQAFQTNKETLHVRRPQSLFPTHFPVDCPQCDAVGDGVDQFRVSVFLIDHE